jgi:hypothetical protein
MLAPFQMTRIFYFAKAKKSLTKLTISLPLNASRTQAPEHLAHVANSADNTQVLVAAFMGKFRRFAFWSISFPKTWQQPHSSLVNLEYYPPFFLGFFLWSEVFLPAIH